jgi:hypothetical protein
MDFKKLARKITVPLTLITALNGCSLSEIDSNERAKLENSRLKKELNASEVSRDSLDSEIKKRDNLLGILNQENDEYSTRVDSFADVVGDQESAIGGLKEDIVGKDSLIKGYEREIEKLKEDVPDQKVSSKVPDSSTQKPKVMPTQEQIAGLDSVVVEEGNYFGDLYGALNYELKKEGKTIGPRDIEVIRNGKILENFDYANNDIWKGDILVVKKEAPVVEKEVIPFADLKTADLNGDGEVNLEDSDLYTQWYKGNDAANLTDKEEFNRIELNTFDFYELIDVKDSENMLDREHPTNDEKLFNDAFDKYIDERDAPKVEEKKEGKALVGIGTKFYDGSIVLETSFDHLFDNGFGLGLGVSGSEDNASVLGRVSVGNDDVRAGLMGGVTFENPDDDGRDDLRTPVTLGAFAQARIPRTEGAYVEINGGITGVERTLDSNFDRGKFGSVKLGWAFGDDGRPIELKPVEIYELEDSTNVDSSYTAPDSLTEAEFTDNAADYIEGLTSSLKDTRSAVGDSSNQTLLDLLIEGNEQIAQSQEAIVPIVEELVKETKKVVKAQAGSVGVYDGAEPYGVINYADFLEIAKTHGSDPKFDKSDYLDNYGPEFNMIDFGAGIHEENLGNYLDVESDDSKDKSVVRAYNKWVNELSN